MARDRSISMPLGSCLSNRTRNAFAKAIASAPRDSKPCSRPIHRNRETSSSSIMAIRSTSLVTRGRPSNAAATPPITAAGTLACLSHAVVAASATSSGPATRGTAITRRLGLLARAAAHAAEPNALAQERRRPRRKPNQSRRLRPSASRAHRASAPMSPTPVPHERVRLPLSSGAKRPSVIWRHAIRHLSNVRTRRDARRRR